MILEFKAESKFTKNSLLPPYFTSEEMGPRVVERLA